MKIIEANTPEALQSLEGEWRGLQAQCPRLTPFQTWEWISLWQRHFGGRKRLRILLFRAEETGALCGVAPLCLGWHRGMPLRRLAWMGTGISDYLGALALPECEEAVFCAFWNYLCSEMRDWDYADLQQLRYDSPLLAPNEAPSGFSRTILPLEPCPTLLLPPTWEDLTKSLGKKMRSNLGYYDRLLLRTFPDAERFVANAETLQEGMEALFSLHQRRWNARWLPGVLGGARVQAFHHEAAQLFLERGWLRLHLLRIEGRIRAALYAFAVSNRTFYYLGGFDPELSKFSIGTLLNGWAIRTAIEEGDAEFDFLRGNEDYKYRWNPEKRMNQQLLLIPKTGLRGARGRAGLALNHVEHSIEIKAKAFAEKQGRKKPTPTETASS